MDGLWYHNDEAASGNRAFFVCLFVCLFLCVCLCGSTLSSLMELLGPYMVYAFWETSWSYIRLDLAFAVICFWYLEYVTQRAL